MELLKLGQKGPGADHAVWLNIVSHNGQYITWGDADDGEVREMLDIPADKPLPGIKVRRSGHPARNAYLRDAMRKYRRLGTIPTELEEKLDRESVAHAVLLDWRGIAGTDGEVVGYTPEIGSEAFKADPDFYQAVVVASTREENFRAQAIKEDATSLGES